MPHLSPSRTATQLPRRPGGVLVVLGVVLVAGLGLLVWWMLRADLPSDAEKAEYIAGLEAAVLPVVADLQVEYFMDEPGCANLTYPGGDFVDGDPERCGGTTAVPSPFDAVARADHRRVAAALEESGTPVQRTGGTFGVGRSGAAWFMSTEGAPFATSWELLYDPAGLRPKPDTDQVTATPVPGEHGWWFVCCAD